MEKISYLTKAAKITVSIFNAVSNEIKPGARECEIARRIESIIKKRGFKRSFRTIVASGPNAAKPHAKVTGRKIKKSDLVVVDFGVIYKGRHSDFTRTVIVGRISPRMRRLYNTAKMAQRMAIKSVRPGLAISDFVGGIYGYIRKKGFGKYILHSLGHGIGKKVHEAPKLSEKNRRMLKKNIVVTIEPGLYIKGKCGVRIEDMVFIGKKKRRVLTK
ncbi:MAG: M24 family metallopeptidase [Candidatus Omnitrophica bacterium]|nr:M24 family metallopeptidase [Candidatus Omnitrophota bacterium]